MTDNSITIDEIAEQNALIMSVGGRIDSGNAPDFGARLVATFERGEMLVLVDFSRLSYLTSAGFRALLIAMDAAENVGARLALCAMPPAVSELFEMGGLADVFDIFSSRADALAG
jgi:anti-anti-sigma factor